MSALNAQDFLCMCSEGESYFCTLEPKINPYQSSVKAKKDARTRKRNAAEQARKAAARKRKRASPARKGSRRKPSRRTARRRR